MENKELIINSLEKFIIKIKNYTLSFQIFKYYVQDHKQIPGCKDIKVNFECIEKQIKRGILSQKNSYWGLKLSEIEAIEKFANQKEGLSPLREEIEQIINCDVNEQMERIELEAKRKEDEEKERVVKVLGDRPDKYEKVIGIIQDDREYKYKSDKCKALLNIHLNVDQIFEIMNMYEHLVCARSYVEKFYKERLEAMVNKK